MILIRITVSVVRYLIRIRPYDRIPPLPGGYTSEYAPSALERDCRRVMARRGIRSPRSLKRALKRYRVNTVDELVEVLGHYEYRRDVSRRAHLMAERLIGGLPYPPHRRPKKKRKS